MITIPKDGCRLRYHLCRMNQRSLQKSTEIQRNLKKSHRNPWKISRTPTMLHCHRSSREPRLLGSADRSGKSVVARCPVEKYGWKGWILGRVDAVTTGAKR
jgi:hypothetical protein